MSDGAETVVGFPALRAAAAPAEWPPRPPPTGPWTLEGLARRDPAAEQSARREAMELSRALAAQAIARAPGASAHEYPGRLAAIEQALWPSAPLVGYRLESSLGAFLIAKLAMAWAPAAPRVAERALDAAGLEAELLGHGLPAKVAAQLASELVSVRMSTSEEGPGPGRLAGLAEGGLTLRERRELLAQAAASPRVASELASVWLALDGVRRVLPVLPSPLLELGPAYVPAAAALALGLPERAIELVQGEPSSPALDAIAELASAALALAAGERVGVEEPGRFSLPPASPAVPSFAPKKAASIAPPASEDDVLEVVEEALPPPELLVIPPETGPRLPAWTADAELVEARFLAAWSSARHAQLSAAAALTRVLGVVPHPGAPSLPHVALPPDPSTLAALMRKLGGGAASVDAVTDKLEAAPSSSAELGSPEPQLAAARAALRALASAVEGLPPTEGALSRAGDLEWAIARARILALGAVGDLTGAALLAQRLSGALPEDVRWVEARGRRYGGGGPVPRASAAEVRRAAAALVRDLSEAMLRSVSGALA